jgi:EamA domain-containing membrane protein RarD
MPSARLFGFALVWIALMVLAYDGVRNRKPEIAISGSRGHSE